MQTDKVERSAWRSVTRIGSLLLPAAAVLALITEALGNLVIPIGGLTGTFEDGLTYIANNSFLFNLEYGLLTVACLAFLLSLVGLFHFLRRTDVGLAAAGTVLSAVGLGIVLSNVSQSFFLVKEATVYAANACVGCTILNLDPSQAAAGAGSFAIADEIGLLVVLAGVMILSSIMLEHDSLLGRSSGYTGLSAGVVGIVGTCAGGYLSGDVSDIVALLPFLLLAAWAFPVGHQMWRVPE